MDKLKIYTDGHVPSAVAKQSRRQASGIDIVRCEEIGLKDADDDAHWAYVLEQGRILVTADQGFLSRAADLNRQGKTHPGIIFIGSDMQGEKCIGPLVHLLIFLHQAIEIGAASIKNDIENRVQHIKPG